MDKSPFKGTPRSIENPKGIPQSSKPDESKSGYVNSPPESQTNVIVVQTSDILPKELQNNFWSFNLNNKEDITVCDLLSVNYCPCCVGPSCSEIRKSDWRRAFHQFSFYILIIQCIVFILTIIFSPSINVLFQPSSSTLLSFGSLSVSKIKGNYQFYRLITYTLLHGNLPHVLFNSLAQITFCFGIEQSWGTIKYIIIYTISGIIGGLFSAAFSKNGSSVGASAAIFGVLGCYTYLTIALWDQVSIEAKPSVLLWIIFMPILFLCVSFIPNVDIYGHLGGLMGGVFLGMIMFSKSNTTKLIGYVLTAVVVGLSFFIIFK